MNNLARMKSTYPVDQKTGLTLPLSKSLGLQEFQHHRALVTAQKDVLANKYDRFGWARDRNAATREQLILDWIEALQDFPLSGIIAARRNHVRDNPNKVPNEGHICALIIEARNEALRQLEKKQAS